MGSSRSIKRTAKGDRPRPAEEHLFSRRARDAAFVMRKKIAQGIDPVAERKRERQVIPTFRKAAELVHEEREKAWKNGEHQNQWLATLRAYAFPKLGDLLVSDIEGPLIRDVLAPIWLAKPETARPVRQRIGTVLDWSYAKGFRATEALMRSLSKGLPRRPLTSPMESFSGFASESRKSTRRSVELAEVGEALYQS